MLLGALRLMNNVPKVEEVKHFCHCIQHVYLRNAGPTTMEVGGGGGAACQNKDSLLSLTSALPMLFGVGFCFLLILVCTVFMSILQIFEQSLFLF